jgi:hypothetical protein
MINRPFPAKADTKHRKPSGETPKLKNHQPRNPKNSFSREREISAPVVFRILAIMRLGFLAHIM